MVAWCPGWHRFRLDKGRTCVLNWYALFGGVAGHCEFTIAFQGYGNMPLPGEK